MLDTLESTQKTEQEVLLNGLPSSAIRAELDRILRSRVFVHSHRIRRFLQFVVEECLLGQQHRLKEYLIGLEVFKRLETFDPRVDSIVRVEARRLRAKLEEYYQTEGREAEIRIELRKGSYVPLFELRRRGVEPYGQSPPARRSTVAVGRFVSSNGHEPSKDGSPDEIVRRLTHVLINQGCCHVVAGYDESREGDGASAGARPDYLLEGSLEPHEDKVKILAQLMNLSERTYVWSGTGRTEDIDMLARSLNRALVTTNSQLENRRLRRNRGRDQSFDHYLQGRYLWKLGTPDSIRTSATVFAKAVERDPAYAAAWAALAEALLVSSIFGFVHPREARVRIKEAAQKAIEQNDNLPEAHLALGAALSIFDWDWENGEKAFQRALRLDGHDPSIHVAYGMQLACRGMLGAASAEIERALELDPASLSTNFVLGWLRGVSKRYPEAIAQHTLVSQLAPDFPLAYLGLGWAHAGQNQFSDALAYLTNASNLLKCRTLLSGCIGYCSAKLGHREEAMRILAQLTSQPPTQYTSPISMAAIHAGLGENDRAFNCLEQALEVHDCSLPIQLLNPEFAELRSDSRYQGLISKLGLGASRFNPEQAV